jgi:transmembrane sensor
MSKALELLRKYLLGKANKQEQKKVDDWYNAVNETTAFGSADEKESQRVREAIYEKISTQLDLRRPKPLIPFYRKTIFRAAAIFILATGTLTFLLWKNNGPGTGALGKNEFAKSNNDIKPPSRNKALLKLADGTTIQLDSTNAGTLAIQDKIKVIKQADGRITYKGNGTDKISYNTLTVPKGSTPVKLVLADGSEVWLNVASSITYPTAFTGNERQVEISGEAYFEVAKNKEKPFIVKRSNSNAAVKVLGTHFNVNAYEDERVMKVTLLEGSVNVSTDAASQVLHPGQQAQLYNQTIRLINDADIEEVMAWKNGRFYFEGADIKTVMRQVEKWYNVEVKFEADIPYSFVAKISRDVNVSELLKIMALTDLVHFKIENNKIIVMK